MDNRHSFTGDSLVSVLIKKGNDKLAFHFHRQLSLQAYTRLLPTFIHCIREPDKIPSLLKLHSQINSWLVNLETIDNECSSIFSTSYTILIHDEAKVGLSHQVVLSFFSFHIDSKCNEYNSWILFKVQMTAVIGIILLNRNSISTSELQFAYETILFWTSDSKKIPKLILPWFERTLDLEENLQKYSKRAALKIGKCLPTSRILASWVAS